MSFFANRCTLASAIVLALSAVPALVRAQTSPPADSPPAAATSSQEAADGATDTQLEAVTVTAQNRTQELQRILREHPLGMLVSHSEAGLDAEHIPFDFVPNESGNGGVLRGDGALAQQLPAVTLAGAVCRQVPGVPAAVQTNSARFWSRQKSPTIQEPEVGGPFRVFGLPFW